MHLFSLRTIFRWTLLLGAVVGMTVALANRDPVPFPVLLASILPASLLGVWWIRKSVRNSVNHAFEPQEESDQRFEEIIQRNQELTRELLESRILDENQELQSKAFDAFLQGVTITDPNRPGNPIVYANEGFTRLTGYDRHDALGNNCRFLQGKETSEETLSAIRAAIREERPCIVEVLNYRKDGTQFWNALSIAPIFDEGRLTHFVGVQTDITTFKQMELQLRQSQKMEAIGHLAGGIAHDFNNILTVILGCCELMRTTSQLPEDTAILVNEVHRAGERAATLTRQLLAFSRKTVLQTSVLTLNDLVVDFEKLLGRLIGEDVELRTNLRSASGYVRVDVGQMEQVLMNLVVNARDAMPKGGSITVGTRDVYLDDEYVARQQDLTAGRYVLLSVSDTGCGMDRATLARIFEPFFTTKAIGKGTGLGLAMVYGIVKASGGHATVESEPGRGTSFHLFLPAVDQPENAVLSPSRCPHPPGTETVLLVEDEVGVRSLARQALESKGYRVLEASDGEIALQICRDHGESIDLILSDVVMPRMGGRELCEKVADICPSTRVIFTSGYTDDAVVRNGVYQAESDFLQKPFTVNTLLRKVREVLDRPNQVIMDHFGSRA